MTHVGVRVPPGFTCTVRFFQPWLESLRAMDEWAALRAPEGNTNALKRACLTLRLHEAQHRSLAPALGQFPDDALFAVRSSALQEDTAAASFAGGYESLLGVTKEGIPDALRHVFASAFDERILAYKRSQRLSTEDPRIAVIVQLQLDATRAGVGFSLNPLTNDHDEIVIDANSGLGESVVSGLVSPDQFTVDRPSRSIVERKLGTKEKEVVLGSRGGTETRPNTDASSFSLADGEVLEVVDAIVRIDEVFEAPMDIEWAFTDTGLHILQARPITTHVPLTAEMMTEPNEPRRLYFDFGLVDIMTINQPMTPLTIDWMFGSLGMWITPFIGPVDLSAVNSPARSLVFASGGRPYLNFSQLLTLVDVRRFAGASGGASQMDQLTAQLLENVDVDRYRATKKLPGLRWLALLRRLPRAVFHMARYGLRVLRAVLRSQQFHREFERVIERTREELHATVGDHLTVRELINELNRKLTPIIGRTAAPPMSAYMHYMMKYMARVDGLVNDGSEEDRQLAKALSRGFSGNEATIIGIQLHRMARLLPRDALEDLDELARRVADRSLPHEFLVAWDSFMDEFGARGPNELELSNPRYGDDPRLALEQMSYMADTAFDPEAAQDRHAAERERAYQTLLGRLSGRQRRRLKRVYRILDLYGPARDTPKHLWVLDNGAVRRRALLEGRRFVERGRLDAPEDIFWLTLDEIDAGNADPTVDLRKARDAKRPLYDELDRVATFPHLIDSRGRIVQAKRPAADANTLAGQGISSGRAVGRVKVLRRPREKPIESGDVLVTYTTDPGWTPLFVNAEAIVLEIGGMLQHGGVVAREYGKPCVVGIQGITKRLRDGQLVEVDGGTGVVRLLPPESNIAAPLEASHTGGDLE